MRNPSLPLSDRSLDAVCSHSQHLYDAIGDGRTVTLAYTKRDGSRSTSTGVLLHTLGAESTLSVRIDTPDKGERTINLAGLISVRDR